MVHRGCSPAPLCSFPEHIQTLRGVQSRHTVWERCWEQQNLTGNKTQQSQGGKGWCHWNNNCLGVIGKWIWRDGPHCNALLLLTPEWDQHPATAGTWHLQAETDTRLLPQPAKQLLPFLQKITGGLGMRAGTPPWQGQKGRYIPPIFVSAGITKFFLCCFISRISHLSI